MLNFGNCHPVAPSLPRHLFKEACQKRSLKKVSFELGDPDEGDAKVIFMICYKGEKGAKRKRGTGRTMTSAPCGKHVYIFALAPLSYLYFLISGK